MQLGFLVITFLAGVALSVQVAINRQLGMQLGSASGAAFASFLIGTAALAAFLTVTQASLSVRGAVSGAPWWAWLGGVLGAFYVVTATLVVARIGVASLLALSVSGQLLASLVIDHYGLLGLEQQSVSLSKLAGSLLLMMGMWLIIR
jgi:bacterial/archaeal transporter family-2 protein